MNARILDMSEVQNETGSSMSFRLPEFYELQNFDFCSQPYIAQPRALRHPALTAQAVGVKLMFRWSVEETVDATLSPTLE